MTITEKIVQRAAIIIENRLAKKHFNDLTVKVHDKYLSAARQAIEDYENSLWQPIESAPKNRPVLLQTENNMYVGHWVQHIETGDEAFLVAKDDVNGWQLIVKAQFWRDLPERFKDVTND